VTVSKECERCMKFEGDGGDVWDRNLKGSEKGWEVRVCL